MSGYMGSSAFIWNQSQRSSAWRSISTRKRGALQALVCRAGSCCRERGVRRFVLAVRNVSRLLAGLEDKVMKTSTSDLH